MTIFREASCESWEKRAAAEAPEYMQERYSCTVAEIRRGNWMVFWSVLATLTAAGWLYLWLMDAGVIQ